MIFSLIPHRLGLAVLLALALALLPGRDGRAQDIVKELLEFPSTARGAPITVGAELLLPAHGEGKLPAMVIVHGSGGVSDAREYAYAREFVKMGVAAIVPDSFAPRGVRNTVEDQTAVTSNDMIADAFALLKLAAVHPRLDPARIGITGFSKGGTVAMRTGLQIMADRHAPNGPRFALHVPFYAGCDNFYRDMRTTGAPMLVLIGGADTYVGPQRCIDAVDRMRAAGSTVDMIVYPDAQHGWDGVGRAWSYPRGENYSRCTYVQQADRSWMEQTSGLTTTGSNGQPIPDAARKALAACKTLGVSGAPDPETKQKSLEQLKSAMRAALNLN